MIPLYPLQWLTGETGVYEKSMKNAFYQRGRWVYALSSIAYFLPLISHCFELCSKVSRHKHDLEDLHASCQGPYPRGAGAVERRGPFGRPEDDYGRGGYDGGPRFFPNGGGPRNYHEDQRGYHGDNLHFPAERRAPPPSRRVRAWVSYKWLVSCLEAPFELIRTNACTRVWITFPVSFWVFIYILNENLVTKL